MCLSIRSMSGGNALLTWPHHIAAIDSAATCRLSSPALSPDATARARSLLLVDTWLDVVTEVAYQADLAGLSSYIELKDGDGIEVAVSGFSEKLPTFAATLFEARPACQTRLS
jgi:secreted Zn-dependent insulinase-like peptidase